MKEVETKVSVKESEALKKVVANELKEGETLPEDLDIQKLLRENEKEGQQDGGVAGEASKKKEVPQEAPWSSPKPLEK